MGEKQYYVYIMTNKHNTVLHTGVTNDIIRRAHEHKEGLVKGFTKRYNVINLVFYQECNSSIDAIAEEKRIKGGSRKKKIALIESINPEWIDLYPKMVN
ncbi:MAG: GIY-YIG nuclease family protein [Candidatus Electryonea clarkiae]|nr:GIY-YIG nuclease family protein [Candidatus Electryonea clarkiae]MDP8287602.1 GIY-YIG nuclease family protein [Candidatus Electryonea clarkiae]